MIGFGLVMPNGVAGAIAPFPKVAGAASALLGFAQMAFAALVASAIGALGGGQTVMAAVIASAGLAALLATANRPARLA